MRYFLVVGETSGDLHAARLMDQLRKLDDRAEFAYMGGKQMSERGGTCIARAEEVAFMGIVDVATHLPLIRKTAKKVQQALLDFRPDAIICVDYAGFCFRYILPFAKVHLPASKVVYYIPPKVWAWKKHRIRKLRTLTDLVLCILPFEVAFFEKHKLTHAHYVGNPTYETIAGYSHTAADPEEEYVALLCGSRRSEVQMNLPLMLQVTADLGVRAVIAAAPDIEPGLIKEIVGHHTHVQIVQGDTYGVVSGAHAALVTSGTATLETALLGTPQVVCYAVRGGHLANFVYTHFFTAPYISLVNLIAGHEVVPELFGGLFRKETVRQHLSRLMQDPAARTTMLRGYDEVRQKLRTDTSASENAATRILRLLAAGPMETTAED